MSPAGPALAVELFGSRITWSSALTALIILVAAILLAWVLRRAIQHYSAGPGQDHRAALYTVSRVATYAAIGFGVLFAASALGLPLSRWAVPAGALGIGLGFGVQTIFSNFVSGLILLFDKSLRVGDYIELESGVTGEVREIKIRATRVVTNDNIDILVPNSQFVNGSVISWTQRDVSKRLRIPFGVAYGTDKETVKQAALEAAAAVPFTIALEGPRRPQVWLTAFGDSSLNFELAVWLTEEATMRPAAVEAAYNWELHSALQRHGIEIPFPQRDLNLRSLFGLEAAQARRALRLDEAPEPADEPVADPARTADAAPDSGNDAIEDVNGASAQLPGAQEDREQPAR